VFALACGAEGHPVESWLAVMFDMLGPDGGRDYEQAT